MLNFYKKNKKNNKLLNLDELIIGTEIEYIINLEKWEDIKKIAKTVEADIKDYKLKIIGEGTLNNKKGIGIEITYGPFLYKEIKSYLNKLKRIIKKIRSINMNDRKINLKINNETAFHIHIDKKSLEEILGENFNYFLIDFIYNENNRKFLKKIANRDFDYYSEEFYEQYYEKYLKNPSFKDNNKKIEEIKKYKKKQTYIEILSNKWVQKDIYLRTNYHLPLFYDNRKDTFEIRIFKSDKKLRRIKSYLKFIQYLANYYKVNEELAKNEEFYYKNLISDKYFKKFYRRFYFPRIPY